MNEEQGVSAISEQYLEARSSTPKKSTSDVPKTEKVEWLNKAVKNLWPIIQPIAVMIVTKLLDLKLSKLDLGQHPLQITGVRIPEPATDKISLEVNFCFFTNGEIALQILDLSPSVRDFAVIGRLQLRIKFSEIMQNLRDGFKDALNMVGNIEIFYLNLPAVVKSADGIDGMPNHTRVIRVDIHELSGMDGFKNIIICLQLGPETVQSKEINVRKRGKIQIPSSSETSLTFFIPQVFEKDNFIKLWWKKNPRRMSAESNKILNDDDDVRAMNEPPQEDYNNESASSVNRRGNSNLKDVPTSSGQVIEFESSTDQTSSKRFFLDMWQSEDSDEGSDVDSEALYAIIDVSEIHERSINGNFPMIPAGNINLTAALVHMDHSQVATNFALLEVFLGRITPIPEFFLTAKVCVDNQAKEFLTQANEPDFFGHHCTFFINDPNAQVLTISISEINNPNDLGKIECNMSDLMERQNMTMEKESFLVLGSAKNLLLEMTIKLSGLKR